ncbi:MAG: hypothetical protein ABIB71_07765 [Candidatus Woesearchaeota archaeon]
MKKAQVTLFVILGIVIASAVIFSAYLFRSAPAGEEEMVETIGEIKGVEEFRQEMLSCLEADIADGLITIEMQGGYYELPDQSLEGITAYYLYQGKEALPGLGNIEDELEAYSENTVCLDTLAGNAEIGMADAEVSIGEGLIRITVDIPAVLKTEDAMIEAQSGYIIELPSSLREKMGLAGKVVESEARHRGMISLTMLSEYNITATTTGSRIVVYEIDDELLQQSYGDAKLRFATKW